MVTWEGTEGQQGVVEAYDEHVWLFTILMFNIYISY